MGLTLRTVKGSALTYQELDDNFTYLSSSMTASSGVGFPYTGSAEITGSLILTGSADINGNVIINNSSDQSYVYLNGLNGVNEVALSTPILGSDIVKARFLTINGITDWAAFSINASYNGGWNLDKTSSIGGFFKLDVRDAYKSISFLGIPSGSNPHVDEFEIMGMNLETGIVSIYNSLNAPSITGSLNGTASYSLNATPAFPFTGSAEISGSLNVTGSIFNRGKYLLHSDNIYYPYIFSATQSSAGDAAVGINNNDVFSGSLNITTNLDSSKHALYLYNANQAGGTQAYNYITATGNNGINNYIVNSWGKVTQNGGLIITGRYAGGGNPWVNETEIVTIQGSLNTVGAEQHGIKIYITGSNQIYYPQYGYRILFSGSTGDQNTFGSHIVSNNSGSGINYGLYVDSQGTGASNIGAYIKASQASSNIALQVVGNSIITGSLRVTGSIIIPATQSVAPTWSGSDGEIVPATVGGSYFLYMWMAGAWRSGSFK